MPAAILPRDPEVTDSIVDVTPLFVPTGFFRRTHSGVVNTRTTTEVGRFWSEEYGLLNIKKPEVQAFLSWIRWAWRNRIVFEADHPSTPGSGIAPSGNPQGTPLVNGGGQTGSSLDTDGWTPSQTGLLLPGDLIRIAGINRSFEVLDSVDSDGSGEAVIEVDPPIYSGISPADNAAITVTGNKMNVVLAEQPNVPSVENSFYYSGLVLNFVEVPNE